MFAALILCGIETRLAQAQHQALPPPLLPSPIPFVAPPSAPKVARTLPIPAPEAYPNLAPGTPVRVTTVVVDGSTTLTPEQIAGLTQGLEGPATPTSSIEAARLKLLRFYRDGGYPLVTVSAALGANGRLRFIVTEGRISDVKLEGDIGPAGTKVLQFLNNLIKPGPTSTDSLERWLLIAQDVPGVSLQTVLRPSETEPGSLVLIARVTRSPISGFVVADNRAYKYTGPEQILAVAGYNSLTSLGERTEISIYKSLTNRTQIFGQAAFETFIGKSGLRLRIYGGAGNTTPTGTLATVGYNGETEVGGIQLAYPLLYSRRQKLSIVGLFDVFETSTFQSASGNVPTTHDGLRIFRIGADYALLDQLFGAAHPAENRLILRVSHGIDGLGSSNTGSTMLSRPGSVMDFTSVSGEISRNQTLFSPWGDASVSLLTMLTGQGSRDILPPEEQFHLGGLRFNRGYYAGEISGDSAIVATAELQLTTSAHIEPFGKPRDIGLQFYSYYDWGQTYQNRPLDTSQHLTSVGVGLRTSLTQNIELDLEGVTRLNRQPQTSSAAVAPLSAQAIYWRVLVRF